MTSPYLTIDEAAEVARCNQITVRRAIRAGELQAFRAGGRLLMRQEAVYAWIESRPTAGPQQPPKAARTGARRTSGASGRGSVAHLRDIERKAANG